jgi:hypothetical protein
VDKMSCIVVNDSRVKIRSIKMWAIGLFTRAKRRGIQTGHRPPQLSIVKETIHRISQIITVGHAFLSSEFWVLTHRFCSKSDMECTNSLWAELIMAPTWLTFWKGPFSRCGYQGLDLFIIFFSFLNFPAIFFFSQSLSRSLESNSVNNLLSYSYVA